MATEYTGDPTAAEAPSPAPSLGETAGGDPIGNLPADGDTLNVSSINQALKVPLDWIAFLRRVLAPYKGLRTWSANTTYATGDVVQGPDGKTYKALQASTNKTPASEPTFWTRWAYTAAELVVAIEAAYDIASHSGYYVAPGGLVIQWEYLQQSEGELPESGNVDHTFAHEFGNGILGLWFQFTSLSVDHNLGLPTIMPCIPTKTGCRLSLVPQGASANGSVLTGYLFSLGW